ncbi:hypothetical protein, partial [Pseudomonas aeruginosa]
MDAMPGKQMAIDAD